MHHHDISKGVVRVTSFPIVEILRGQRVKYSVGQKGGAMSKNCVQHGSHALHNNVGHPDINLLFQVPLGVHLADILDLQLQCPDLSERASKLCCVLMSTPDNQQPKPGWEWHLKSYVKMSSERSANISSIISFQLTSLLSRTRPEYIGGYNGQISTSPVYSTTNSPSMRPMTSMGTPARPCFNIFSRAREEM